MPFRLLLDRVESEFFAEFQGVGEPAKKNKDSWDLVVENSINAPSTTTSTAVTYYLEYASGHAQHVVDLSTIFFHDRKAIAVWPLFLWQSGDKWKIGSTENNIAPPLFFSGIAESIQKKIIQHCINGLTVICKLTGQSEWFGEEIVGPNGAGLWHLKLMEYGATCSVSHELFVNLELTQEQIRSSMRKSYRSLINQSKNIWTTEVWTKDSLSAFDEFRALHAAVAGRVTRPLATWEEQYRALQLGQAFFVALRDENSRMVGAAYFLHSQHEAYYGVGAYDRNLFDKPVAHLSQWIAIEHMKKLGLRWYRLGSRPYSQCSPEISEKELNIAHFKEGFATNVFLKVKTRMKVD